MSGTQQDGHNLRKKKKNTLVSLIKRANSISCGGTDDKIVSIVRIVVAFVGYEVMEWVKEEWLKKSPQKTERERERKKGKGMENFSRREKKVLCGKFAWQLFKFQRKVRFIKDFILSRNITERSMFA